MRLDPTILAKNYTGKMIEVRTAAQIRRKGDRIGAREILGATGIVALIVLNVILWAIVSNR